jgi:hypothetical protein
VIGEWIEVNFLVVSNNEGSATSSANVAPRMKDIRFTIGTRFSPSCLFDSARDLPEFIMVACLNQGSRICIGAARAVCV